MSFDVKVRSDLVNKLEDYSELTGQPIQAAINEALEDFLNVAAEARIETIVEGAERAAQA